MASESRLELAMRPAVRDLMRTRGLPIAEVQEAVAAGREGIRCPFCGIDAASMTVGLDKGGVLDASWTCSNCHETGPVDFDGEPHYTSDGVDA